MTDFPNRNLDTLHQRTASGQKQFAAFVEINDNEGEVWVFWLQMLGNEEELGKLGALLHQIEQDEEDEVVDDFPYQLKIDLVEPEFAVDILVRHASSGYMASHQKVTGKFTCPDRDAFGGHADALYKGGIRELFT